MGDPMDIYEPQEDSYLLEDQVRVVVKARPGCSVLDMGTGSGIQAKAAAKAGAGKVLAVDVNPRACQELLIHIEKEKHTKGYLRKIHVRESDLFSAITPSERFDLIIFNAPYLPEEERDPDVALDGGPYGHELIARFLAEARGHLAPGGSILLLFSTRSGLAQVLGAIAENCYVAKERAALPLFFERLFVYELSELRGCRA